MNNTKTWTKILNILALLLLASCYQNRNVNDEGLKTIEIGCYLFDFPADFQLVREQGIDSYVGKIVGDSLTFRFGYGYYSDSFIESTQEYLQQGHWKMLAAHQVMEPNVTYDKNNFPKIEVLNIETINPNDSAYAKGVDFMATCRYAEEEFEFPIYLPEETKSISFNQIL